MQRETIYRGDTPDWQFNIKQPDRSVFVLTGWTATFSAKHIDTGTVLFSKSATVADAATGKVTVSLTEAETDGNGEYTAEVELRHTGLGKVRTCEPFLITIKDDVAK